MVNTRKLKMLFLFILFHSLIYGQQPSNPVRLGIIADPQYADMDDAGTRFYRSSLQKLDTAVLFLNKQELDFTVVLGDFVDQGIKDLSPVMERLGKLKAPLYNILGNHDYVDAPDKDNLYQQFSMTAPYYAFGKGDWQLIVLNTNELSEYATTDNSPQRRDWEVMSERSKSAGRKNAAPWNGGISQEQLQWIEKQLITAEEEGKHVLILSHHPLFPENGLEALNNREILALIEKHSCVRAVISGHHHEGNFAYYKGIPMVTIEGMVETPNRNAYGTVTLYPDRIEISGHGRLTSRILNVKQ